MPHSEGARGLRALLRARGFIVAIVSLLLLVFVAEVALSTRQESPSWDEGDHIYAGYMNWLHDDYFLNPEHPPLVKLVATLPLLPLDLKTTPRQGRFFKDESYYGGRFLLFHNGPRYSADSLLFRIHMAVLVFAVILALLVFLAGQQMFGAAAGLIALALFVFDPTILTNAPFVTTDMGASCGFFAAVFVFYLYVRSMRPRWVIVCGLVTGLALATKHSVIVLPALLVLLAVGELAGRWQKAKRWPGRDAAHMAASLAAIFLIALFILWGIYSFRFAMHPSGVTMPSLASRLGALSPPMRLFVHACLRLHLLPESYLYGLVDVKRVGDGMPAYIFGRLYAHGQWFYFPALLSLKWSVGVLGLLALALYAFATGRVRRPREVFFLACPALLYFSVAMAWSENIGVRHVLPMFAFIFVLAGGGAAWLASRRAAWALVVVALLAWHAAVSLRCFPNYMPFANVLWGGPSKTHLYFSDSATEWGQELKWVKQYTDEHHITHCWFAYFPAPFLLPSDYGIPCRLLPTDDTRGQLQIYLPPVLHGPLFLSFADLNGFEFGTRVRNPYQVLFERRPDAVIADGVAVYNGDFVLPRAQAMVYESKAAKELKAAPKAAVADALQAVALTPEGFDANMALGGAYAAAGEPAVAEAAYSVALACTKDMEPSSRVKWRAILKQRLHTVTVVQGNP